MNQIMINSTSGKQEQQVRGIQKTNTLLWRYINAPLEGLDFASLSKLCPQYDELKVREKQVFKIK